jgi:hypothetical protein
MDLQGMDHILVEGAIVYSLLGKKVAGKGVVHVGLFVWGGEGQNNRSISVICSPSAAGIHGFPWQYPSMQAAEDTAFEH